jgi:hypothetical protein
MRRFLLPSLMVLLAASSAALAQSALRPGTTQFTVTQDGKHVGDTQSSTAAISGGDALTSSGGMKLDKFSYSFQSSATVDSQGNLVRDRLTGSVQSAKVSGNNIQFDTASDSTGRSFQINVTADGKHTTNSVTRHRNTVLMPDLDPAAYALMAHLALSQPQTAWVLVPKQDGILVPAHYRLLSDLNGTLNGQHITVKHSAVAVGVQNAVVVELFYTASGDLLEADLDAQGLQIAQNGFKLLNRPKPVPPPAGEAPQQNGQQGGQQSPQQDQPQQGQEQPQQ